MQGEFNQPFSNIVIYRDIRFVVFPICVTRVNRVSESIEINKKLFMRSLHQLDGFVPLTKSKLTTCALLRKSTRTRTFEAESLCCGKQLNHVHNVSPENISPRLCHLHGGLHQDHD